MSKSLGATVVATQVAKEVVTWDTPVSELMPGFELADSYITDHATVGDFYSHRSGLPTAVGDDLEDIGYDREYVLSHLVHEPLVPFREVYNYSNFGMTVGAEAVAEAAGTSWEDLAERELYAPLGMTSTSSRYEDFLAQREPGHHPRQDRRLVRGASTNVTPTSNPRPVVSPRTSTTSPSGCS